MAETGTLAAWLGHGEGFAIREYPVPDPAPGAILIGVALANICGSDMHYWVRTRGRYPYHRILSHRFPLAEINEAFRRQEDGHITRGALVPN